MTTHSSILAWKIPCTEEPGGLQSPGSQRVGHNWATHTTVRDYVGGVQNHADGDCSHEIKRHLLPARITMTNLDSIIKNNSTENEQQTRTDMNRHFIKEDI